MSNLISFEKQLLLVETIIASTNELIPMLKLNFDLNESLHSTIDQIFNFLNKVINLLPATLLCTENLHELKLKLISHSISLQHSWKEFAWLPDEFFRQWELFHSAWMEFDVALKTILAKPNIIYISMN